MSAVFVVAGIFFVRLHDDSQAKTPKLVGNPIIAKSCRRLKIKNMRQTAALEPVLLHTYIVKTKTLQIISSTNTKTRLNPTFVCEVFFGEKVG